MVAIGGGDLCMMGSCAWEATQELREASQDQQGRVRKRGRRLLLGGCQAARLSMLGRPRESELLESVRVADVHLGAACDLSYDHAG